MKAVKVHHKIPFLSAIVPTAIFLISSLLLGSCTREPDGGLQPDAGTLYLSVAIKEAGLQTVTRTTIAPEPGEDNIVALYLLFFEPDATGNGKFIDYVAINNLNPGANTPIHMSSHPELAVSKAYDILAVANIGDDHYVAGTVNAWMQQWANHTLNDVKAQATAWLQVNNSTHAISPNDLLMHGSINKAENQFNLHLELMRSMIRFDIVNNQNETHDLVSAELWNAYPSHSIWGSRAMNDFSNNVARISYFYGVDNSQNLTTTEGADGRGVIVGDITGGLYCFENQVVTPGQNDHATTCVIVGLKERATGTTNYYRMNVNPESSPQILNLNNVYRISIRNVNYGSPTAAEAYTAAECGLDYIINRWDMGDYGLIIQDGNSILSIPSKTITIDKNGGDLNYHIFTYNNTGTSSPLIIRNQTYTPANGSIAAALDGNMLTIHATPLGSETERTGTLVIAYAGLEATVNVVQNQGDDDYLKLHLPVGGFRPLAPYAGIATKEIRVEASGAWTAELLMPRAGFTLDPNKTTPQTATTMLRSNDALVTDNRFKVYTWSANPDNMQRECFVVVTLDNDPENHAGVVELVQSPAGGIQLTPNMASVTFNGTGRGLAAIAGNTVTAFNVLPSTEDDGNGNEVVAQWGYEIRTAGAADDTGRFTVVDEQHDRNNVMANRLTVGATGENLSERTYTALLRVYLSQDQNTYTDLQLIQQPLTVSLSPGTLPAITTKGGLTNPITVMTDASLTWSATLTDNSGAASDGRRLVRHPIRLVDQNGASIEEGTKYPVTTQIRLLFPKVYYPNRDIPISATLTVNVEGVTDAVTVNQTTLTARPMVGYGMIGAPNYGALGTTYNQGWDGTSGTYGLAQIPGYERLGTGNMSVTGIQGNVNYLHVTAHIGGTAGENYDWAVINDFIDTRDAWTVISSQDANGLPPVNNPNSPLKRNGAGYNNMVNGAVAGNSQVYQDRPVPTKLYQFTMNRGHTPLAPSDLISASFYNDAVYNTIPGPWPSTAVVLMTKVTNDDHASLIVDIPNKFLWMGESQLFWDNARLTNNRGVFLDNLMYFIANASKYGSHFTDLLLENNQPGAQPAPWDTSYWGANAGVPSK